MRDLESGSPCRAWHGPVLALLMAGLAAGPAAADWLRTDARVVGQSGYLFGLAAHCGLEAGSALLLETMAYVDTQEASAEDRRQAGQQFRAGSEIAGRDMADPSLALDCADARLRIEQRLEALKAVNAEGGKLRP